MLTPGLARPAQSSVPARAAAPTAAARARAVRDLTEFLRFPSVSAQPRHAADVRRCAGWLARHLAAMGMERVAVRAAGGAPVVTAEWRRAPGRPTLLIYGHYDVQPVEPLSEWRTPPFVPTVVDGALVARGSADDKGPLFAHVTALGSWLRTAGRLPVNVRCLFEGEEEVGSPTLERFLARYPNAAAADAAVMSDTRMATAHRPALTYGLRGALALEVHIRGPDHDLHSGHFGGAVHNPAQALSELIAGLHDPRGRVALAGFYDRVRTGGGGRDGELGGASGDAAILREAGVANAWGERRYSLHERTTSRPALTVNGLTGGYQGPGAKAVIPSRASAKLSFRLVPDQDPAEVERLFRAHVARVAPATVAVAVRRLSAAMPVLLDPGHPVLRAAAEACRRAFGAEPAVMRSGGTIPVVAMLRRRGVPTVLLGLTPPGARIHAPNEHFPLATFHRGVAAAAWFLAALAAYREARP